MKISATRGEAHREAWDLLVVGVGASKRLGPVAARLDESHGGWLTRAVARGDISGKRGDSALIPLADESGPQAALVVGTGDENSAGEGAAWELAGVALRRAVDRERQRVAIACEDLCAPEHYRALVAGAVSASEGQDLYLSKRKTNAPGELWFAGADASVVDAGVALGESVNLTRRLVNEPANVVYPEAFAERAVELGRQWGMEVEVWDEERLRAERCETLLAVGAASDRASRLVKIRYRGGEQGAPALALVGKGVTFDSGGLSLKPSPSMLDMKCDMAGAATVLGAITAAARLGIRQNITAYCGLVENMISGRALKLGDVLRTRSGKTVEIQNTDAEGRLVLADVLDVAADDAPRGMIDLATLTGACMVALGTDVCGLFTNNSPLASEIRAAADQAGELVWELPMFDLYSEQIRGKVADIKNTGDGRWGGAITAAKFLQEFVRDIPWAHLDIAGPAFADSPKPHRDAGATGAMVRTLVRLLET